MNSRWMRLYAEFATDPKVQMLSETMQRRLIMLFCIRCNGDVTLHDDEVAFQLRITSEEWRDTKAVFVAKNFINARNEIVNWDKRQYRSDSSAERVRAHRERKKQDPQQPCNVTVTPQIQNTDTETERKNSSSPDKPVTVRARRNKAEFEEFWNLYPRKVGKGSGEKAFWKARDETEQIRIIGAIKAQRGEMAKREKQYIPHPARWLNDKRYLDEGSASRVEQTTVNWEKWKFPLAAAIGEPAVHSWFSGATAGDGFLKLESDYKRSWINQNYITDVKRIFGPNVELRA